MTQSAEDETRAEIEGLQQMDGGEHLSGAAPATARQPTGDEAVDDVLGQLDAVTDEPLDTQIEIGEQVHRVLQGRLADLGKE
jgi:hypothetical protein